MGAARAGADPPDRSVVVTGLGTTNPLGGNVSTTWEALQHGRCGVGALSSQWASQHDLPVRIGAALAVEPAEMLRPKEVRRLDRASQCALLAAREAWAQAGSPEVDGERLAVSVSPGMGPVLSVMGAWDDLRAKGAGGPLTGLPMRPQEVPIRPEAAVLAGLDADMHLISPDALDPIRTLKVKYLGGHNPRLHTDEVLITLAVGATTDDNARKALDALSQLRNCDVHSSVILGPVDEGVFRNLGVNVTSEPVFQYKNLYRKR